MGLGISLAMIVKNEEKNLACCLEHAKPLVDEVVVVDTGSTDHTREIAVAAGAKCLIFEWSDDFAAARNAALKNVVNPHVLVLDADERFSVQDRDELLADFQEAIGTGLALNFTERNYTLDACCVGFMANRGEYPNDEGGLGWFATPSTRFFPASTKYAGVIHECPIVAVTVGKSTVPIHHFGKLDRSRQETKAWYYNLGLQKLKEHGDGFEIRKELGTQAARNGMISEALEHWLKAAEFKPESGVAFVNICSICLRLKMYPEALAAAMTAAKLEPSDPAALHNLALSQFYAGNGAAAFAILKRLLGRDASNIQATITLGLLQVAAMGRKDDVLERIRMSFGVTKATYAEFCDCLDSAGQSSFAVAIRSLAGIEHGR